MNKFPVEDVNIVAVIPSPETYQDTYGYKCQDITEDEYSVPDVDRIDHQQNNTYHQGNKVGDANIFRALGPVGLD